MACRILGASLAALVLLCMPLASACYPQRIESCRGAISDFSGISNVRLVSPARRFAFESATPSVGFTLSATTTMASGSTCVAVRSELRDARGGIVEVIDTPIRANVSAGSLSTTTFFHYHVSALTPMTVHVTALGTTLDGTVADSPFPDAGVRGDAGLLGDGGASRDTGILPDAGDGGDPDGGEPDAGDPDGGGDPDAALDGGEPDAGL